DRPRCGNHADGGIGAIEPHGCLSSYREFSNADCCQDSDFYTGDSYSNTHGGSANCHAHRDTKSDPYAHQYARSADEHAISHAIQYTEQYPIEHAIPHPDEYIKPDFDQYAGSAHAHTDEYSDPCYCNPDSRFAADGYPARQTALLE